MFLKISVKSQHHFLKRQNSTKVFKNFPSNHMVLNVDRCDLTEKNVEYFHFGQFLNLIFRLVSIFAQNEFFIY